MAEDPVAGLPSDEESPSVLLEDAIAAFQAVVPSYQRQAADLITALLAVLSDEGAIGYALAREVVEDITRDFGRELYGVPDPEPIPARASTRWTARATIGGQISPGEVLVIDAPQGPLAFEVLEPATVAAGASADVPVQAIEPGAQANGATGQVVFDERPAWADSVILLEPAHAGQDAATDEQQSAKVKRAARLQTQAAVDAIDAELKVVDIPGVERALVLNRLDHTDGTTRTGVASIFAIDAVGEPVSDPSAQDAMRAAVDGPNRLLGGTLLFGLPEYTTIRIVATVQAARGRDPVEVKAAVEQAGLLALSPALHGLPDGGQVPRLLYRPTIRRYRVAHQLSSSDLGVEYVSEIALEVVSGPGTVEADGDILMGGYAPLPRAAPPVITVTGPEA